MHFFKNIVSVGVGAGEWRGAGAGVGEGWVKIFPAMPLPRRACVSPGDTALIQGVEI